MPGAGQMHADLVRAPGLDGDVQQRCVPEGLHHLHQRDRSPAVGMVVRHRADVPLAVRTDRLVQRDIDHLETRRPGPPHQRGVDLARLTLAELVLQRRERRALLGQQQDARRLLVQPVHQLQEARLRARPAQLLDDAKAHAAAAMHRDTGRLVDGQQVLVLEQDGELPRWRGLRRGPLGDRHGRHPHFISGRQPGVGRRATLVHPHLTAADDAVDVGLGHALEDAQQKVVQPLASRILVHRQTADGRRGGPVPGSRSRASGRACSPRRLPRLTRRFHAYNGLHHVSAVSV